MEKPIKKPVKRTTKTTTRTIQPASKPKIVYVNQDKKVKQTTKLEKIEKIEKLDEEVVGEVKATIETKIIDPLEGLTNKHKFLITYFKGRNDENISINPEQKVKLWECYYSEFGETYPKDCNQSAIMSYKRLLKHTKKMYPELTKK